MSLALVFDLRCEGFATVMPKALYASGVDNCARIAEDRVNRVAVVMVVTWRSRRKPPWRAMVAAMVVELLSDDSLPSERG